MSRVVVRPAPPLSSYPPLPYRGEELRAVVRREPCMVCGGVIDQYAGEDIAAPVRRHYATACRPWRP